MRCKQVFKVKIVSCSQRFMWYHRHIGKTFECERLRNENKLFAPYTDSIFSYKTLEPIVPSVNGWLLDEDVLVLDSKLIYMEDDSFIKTENHSEIFEEKIV